MKIFNGKEIAFSGNGVFPIFPIRATGIFKLNVMPTIELELIHETKINSDMIISHDNQLYRISRFKDEHSGGKKTTTIYAERLFEVELLDLYTVSFIASNKTIEEALAMAFQGTRYTVGPCDVFAPVTYTATQVSRLSIINALLAQTKGELQIEGTTVSIKQAIGSRSPQKISWARNIVGITRDVDASMVITKLFYSNHDGIFAGSITSPNLINYAYEKSDFQSFEGTTQTEVDSAALNYLSLIDKPRVTYDVEIIDLANALEYQGLRRVNLGDDAIVSDNELNLEISARVLEMEVDLLRKSNTKVVLGNFSENYFQYQADFMRTKATVDYAFNDRLLNVAVIKGIKVIDDNNDKVTFEVSESGQVSIDISSNTDISALYGRLELNENGLSSLVSTITTLDGRIETAESLITQTAQSITTMVRKDDIISMINQSPETISIDATKVNITGFVTFESLSTPGQTAIDAGNIITGSISANRISGGTIQGITININTEATIGNKLNVGGSSGIKLESNNGLWIHAFGNPAMRLWSDATFFDNGIAITSGSSLGAHNGMLGGSYYENIRLWYSASDDATIHLLGSCKFANYARFDNLVKLRNNMYITSDKTIYSSNSDTLMSGTGLITIRSDYTEFLKEAKFNYGLRITAGQRIQTVSSGSNYNALLLNQNEVVVETSLKHNGSYLSFFNKSTVSKQSVSTLSAMTASSTTPSTYSSSWAGQLRTDVSNLRASVDAIRTALVNYGLL